MDDPVEQSISVEDLKDFERKYASEESQGSVSHETKFSYAWAMIRSRYRDDVSRGISMMQGLCKSGSDQRDFLFFIAVGYYRLEDYSTSLAYVDKILASEPRNRQAQSLKDRIQMKLKREGLMGVAIISGGVAIAAATVGLLALAFSKK